MINWLGELSRARLGSSRCDAELCRFQRIVTLTHQQKYPAIKSLPSFEVSRFWIIATQNRANLTKELSDSRFHLSPSWGTMDCPKFVAEE